MNAVTSRGRARLRRERTRLEGSAEETSEINLVPYLDIVTNILLFLLITITSMIAVGNIEVVIPEYARSASSTPKPQQDKPDLNLTVAITGKGFTVAGSSGVMYQNDIPGQLPTVPKQGGERYDFAGLQKLLSKIKKDYPDEEKAILSANPDVQYEVVIGVMDVLRRGASKEVLFPQVLFSTGIQNQ